MTDSNPTPRILILLAAYNGGRYLREQVDSLLAQRGVALQILVSLDPSTDDSEPLLRGWAERDERVKLLPMIGPSGGAARNFFRLLRDADMSGFDYVCFSDQDDIWLEGKLERAVQVMRAHSAQAYSCNVTAFWPDGREHAVVKSQPQRRWDHWFESAGPGCTHVFTQALALDLQRAVHAHWAAVQGLALHDWFSYAYAREHGYRWVIDDKPWLRYRQHGGNEVGANVGWRSKWSRAKLLWRGWWLDQSLLLASVVAKADDPVIDQWSGRGRAGLLWLALNAHHCRRRRRDAFLFGASCLLLAIKGWHPK